MTVRRTVGLLATVLLLNACSATAWGQVRGRKLYISVDMEGVVGVVTGDHLGPAGFEYQKAREFMTREVVAAIEAAKQEGVTEILVSDSHGNGENLLIEMLPKDVMIVRSWPRPLMMMEGIDSTFDAAIFLGYHAGTTNPNGVRAHTISSARLADVRLNGRSMLEAGINAAIAGHFGVPVIMISGDDAAIAEAQSVIGDIEGAVVKWSYSFHSAKSMTPAAAYDLIGEKVRAALRRLDQFEPLVLATPVTLDVKFKSYRPSQLLAYLPIVERTDSHSVRYVGQNIIEISKFLEFMTSYEVGLEP
jgi:D-amino peptidase